MTRSPSEASRYFAPVWILLIVMLAPTASGLELLHGIPAYDSGWRSFEGQDS
jgi:hypothetical protein